MLKREQNSGIDLFLNHSLDLHAHKNLPYIYALLIYFCKPNSKWCIFKQDDWYFCIYNSFILLVWHTDVTKYCRTHEIFAHTLTSLHVPEEEKKKGGVGGAANLLCHKQNSHPIVQCLGAAAWSSCLMGRACLPGKTIFDSPAPRDRAGDPEFTVRRRTVGGNPSCARATAAFRCVTAFAPSHQDAAVGKIRRPGDCTYQDRGWIYCKQCQTRGTRCINQAAAAAATLGDEASIRQCAHDTWQAREILSFPALAALTRSSRVSRHLADKRPYGGSVPWSDRECLQARLLNRKLRCAETSTFVC